MTVTELATTASVVVFVVALAWVAWDRRALLRRLHAAEYTLTGVSLDLDATRAKVAELQSFLSAHDAWDADANTAKPVPSQLADRQPEDRWSPLPQGADSTAPQAAGPTAATPEHPTPPVVTNGQSLPSESTATNLE